MPNQNKIDLVNEITEKFSRAKGIYFTDYKGMNVQQLNDLRKEFHAANIEYRVAKKTLTKIAAKNAGYDSIDNLIEGQMGIAFSYDDPTNPAKVITSFVKKNKLESLAITGCIFEKELFKADKISEIMKLQSREELLLKFVGTLVAPMSNLVGLLNASMSQLVDVLESLSKNKKE
ncbi:MAG: 50S ribosomal protein L10 [Candidatus Marinimicrobia bacterium]|nr:50S ribosomal protein L10 [Candidatus Neomarinimicrobiota bacterium]